MKVIINADDLGYSMDTNQAIFSLMGQRRVTSSTLMANGPAFQDAVQHIPDFPDFSFGIHLTLTEFTALTTPQIFYDTKLIDEKGVFAGELHLRQIRPTPALLKALLREWEQQVAKLLDHGVSVSHFDSHHHTHTIPWLFWNLKKLQKRFNIRRVRKTINWYYHEDHRPSRSLRLKKKAWNWALQNLYSTKTTDYFTAFDRFVKNYEGEMYSQEVAELMCHPGQPYSVEETELLMSDWIHQFPFKIELISYYQL
jgi:predicted glycoside hydrolase/deacetylase ChbG (UPF0249 family)